MAQFHVYLNEYNQGPFEIQDLLALPGFSRDTLICCLGDTTWLPAGLFPDVRHYLDNPYQRVDTNDISIKPIYLNPPIPAVDADLKTLRSGFLASFDPETVTVPKRSRLERFLSFWTQGRKGVLVVLSMISVGINYPILDNYLDVYEGLAWPPPSPVRVQGSRIRHGGKIHPWHPWVRKSASPYKTVNKKNAPRSISQLSVIDSQDMKDGLISITVAVTSKEGGVTTHKTLTYLLRQER